MTATPTPATAQHPSTGSGRTSLLAWFVFVVLMVYAVLVGGTWLGIYAWPIRLLSLGVLAIALVAWFLVAWRRPGWRPGTSIWPAVILPLAAMALAVLASDHPRLGLEYLAWAALLAALYLLLVRILRFEYAQARIGGLAALLALVIGVIYIGSVLSAWMEWWGLVGRFEVPPLRPLFLGLTYGNPNAVLTVQVLMTVIAFAGLGVSRRSTNVLLVIVTVLTAIVVVISGSRGGWLAIVGAIVIVAVVWALTAARSGALIRVFRDRRVLVVLAAIGVGVLALAAVMAPSILARVGNSSDGGRLQYFATALRVFEDSPVLGTGPGTWAVRRAAYTEPGELDWYVTHVHDLYLQTAAEIGIVGLLAGLAAVVAIGWLVYRAVRTSDAVQRRWAWATFFGLTYIGLHQVLDFYANMPAVILLAGIPVAFLDATSSARLGIPGLSSRTGAVVASVTRAVFWIACLAAVLVLARTELISATHHQAVGQLFDSAWSDARGPAQQAITDDPDMPPYWVTRGLVAAGEEDWQVAADAFARTAAIDDLPMSWLNLAQAQIELGESDDDVVASLERALRLGHQQAAVTFTAGYLFDRLGLTDRADEAYTQTIATLPDAAAAEWWTRDPAWQTRFDNILAAAAALEPWRAWHMAMMAGDTAAAHEANDSAAASGQTTAIIDAWAGDQAAAEQVFAWADADLGGEMLSWASRIAARNGDPEAAERYQRLAIFTAEGGFLPGADVDIDEDSFLEANPAGTRTSYYGHWLYRRPVSPDLIAPGLPRLVYVAREDAADGDTDDDAEATASDQTTP